MASSARIDELRKKFDENPRRYFAPLANEYRKAGDLEQAIFICQEYLPQQPGHMSGHIVYGQALFELSRFDEARAVFETALSLDPENLIALRHLGDIARQSGDLRGARAWYQRVLEADPRNEEIAQIMLTVLTTPHESQPAVRTGGTPLGTDAVPGADMSFVSTADSAGFPVERSEDGSGLAVGPELSQLAERQPEPEPEPIRRSREAIPDDELLDLNEFSIGDVPMSSLGTMAVEPPPAEPFTETGPAFDSNAAGLDVEELSIERTSDNAPFEADPYAIAAAPVADFADTDEPPPLPPEAFAADLALGLPDDGSAPSLSDTRESAPLEGVDSFSDDASRYSAEPAALIEVESFFSAPVEASSVSEAFDAPVENHEFEPGIEAPQESSWTAAVDLPVDVPLDPHEEFVSGSIAHTPAQFATPLGVPAISEPTPEPEPEPEVEPEPEAFVTETMAELYLQQGHLEAALDIYQRLAEQRPGDERLRERMLAVADAIHDVSIGAPETTEPAGFEAYDSGVAYDGGAAYDSGVAYDTGLAYDDGIANDDGAEVAGVLTGPTIREFLSGLLQPRSFGVAQEFAQRAATPVATDAFDDAPVASEFDQQMYGQTVAAFDEPALDQHLFDTSAYTDTPSYAVESFDASLAEEPIVEHASPNGPTFEESPYDATTLEIDMTSAEFQSLGNSAVDPIGSVDSIDEEFGADTNEWQREGAAFEPVTDESIAAASISVESIEEVSLPTAEAQASTETVEMPVEEAQSSLVDAVEVMPPAVSRPTPSSSETVTGSIDALFSGADASTLDATAATTLAQAFASEVPETPPLQGMPAHRAADELSLDHVFKSNPAPRQEAEGEGFSFDQFFADDMNETAPKPGTEPASSAAKGSDDIAQFNNWLNGLKKT